MNFPNYINILIVEDEALVGLDLSTRLEHEGYKIVGVTDEGQEALSLFKENPVDLLLLDININGEWDGIETAQKISEIRQTPIIYITAQTDNATIERAKHTFPAAYLTKPFTTDNLKIAIELAINNFARKKSSPETAKAATERDSNSPSNNRETILQIDDYIFIKQNYQFTKVKLIDILYLETDNNHVSIITTSKKFTLRLTLNSVLERIHYDKLVRTHRSFAVNLDQIESFNEHEVLIGKHSVPIGRNYKEEFLTFFDFL
ncbi:DNA-binding response regulator, LytR/AlgR family [Pseudarcicella hirudinis]|uniref:DNA-binding response regulator, LytR/AlgR family n=1 Tax=Pseudarcicella hirudinis TaxID=1079859 RepID=A0A1I5QAR0_9BACT|nr:response regulator [Pseudarcicella hirudinis]SFP42926.1 DNA-binding response regulator, LytR/AlgR family [Pseudarcicella hirudinis]